MALPARVARALRVVGLSLLLLGALAVGTGAALDVTVPDCPPEQIRAAATDDPRGTQVAYGNLTASEREQFRAALNDSVESGERLAGDTVWYRGDAYYVRPVHEDCLPGPGPFLRFWGQAVVVLGGAVTVLGLAVQGTLRVGRE